MKKAILMKKITERVLNKNNEQRLQEHIRYANKLIDGKIRNSAFKGHNSVKLKIKRKYSALLVEKQLINHEFKVIRASVNGRAFLTVKW